GTSQPGSSLGGSVHATRTPAATQAGAVTTTPPSVRTNSKPTTVPPSGARALKASIPPLAARRAALLARQQVDDVVLGDEADRGDVADVPHDAVTRVERRRRQVEQRREILGPRQHVAVPSVEVEQEDVRPDPVERNDDLVAGLCEDGTVQVDDTRDAVVGRLRHAVVIDGGGAPRVGERLVELPRDRPAAAPLRRLDRIAKAVVLQPLARTAERLEAGEPGAEAGLDERLVAPPRAEVLVDRVRAVGGPPMFRVDQ